MTILDEVHALTKVEYKRLREHNPNQLDGKKLWEMAEKYVHASLSADWLIFQSNFKLGAFNEK